MTRRLTCDRFYGGVENRLENLQLFLTYLQEETPPRNEAVGWLKHNFDATSETTRDRYLSFLRGLDLVDGSGGQLRPGRMGLWYLETESSETLFEILDATIAGFDLILEALATRGPQSDEELREVLNNGPYGHDMNDTAVAIRHREWLQVLGYIHRANRSESTYRYALTSSGYDLWNRFEDGAIGRVLSTDEEESRPDAPLHSISDNPVPDSDLGNQIEQPSEQLKQETNGVILDQKTATIEHQQVVAWLRDLLQNSGYEVKKTRYSDLIAYRDPEALILLFEVKSITTQNAWKQVRKAIGQVLEYEHTDVMSRDVLTGDVRPGICLSRAPPEEVRNYLEHLAVTRGLVIIWRTDEQPGFEGPSRGILVDELL